MVVEVSMRVLPNLDSLQKFLQESNYRIPNLLRLYLLILITTVVIIIIQLLISLVNTRRNLLQAYRGDYSEIPRPQRSDNLSYSVNNVHFAGYFLGYLIWGIVLVTFLCLLVYGAIELYVIYGTRRMIEIVVKYSLPSSLLLYFKLYLNKFLSKYVFLQDLGDVLAINHRRALMVYIYLSFFLDTFLAVVSSIIRLAKSLIAAYLYMSRMDYSLLGRKLETLDGGFYAYCAFTYVECAHRHPILLIFVSHLAHSIRSRKSSRIARKWRLFVFLSRNPIIVLFRKAYLKQSYENNQHRTSIDSTSDSMHSLRVRF